MRTAAAALPLLLVVLLTLAAGCRKEAVPPSPEQVLAATLEKLAGADFGPDFDAALELLDTLPKQVEDKAVSLPALLARDLALLDLFLTVQLGGDAALYERLKEHLGLQLDGAATDPRNYQICAQALLERFRLVEREAAGLPEVQARARALGLLTNGIQGILFRSKHYYFEGRDAVRAIPELRYLDQVLAARDLVVETLVRGDGVEKNWQNIALTVFGRVCPKAAARYVSMLCTAESPIEPAEEFCHTDLAKIPPTRRARGEGFLGRFCSTAEDGPVGLDALKAYYDPAFDAALADAAGLRPALRNVMADLAARKDEAYAALDVLLK